MENEKQRINVELIVSLIIIVVTVLGSTIPLHLHTSSQIDAIHQEMKDFHGRLERQDAEFKGRLEKQDAEFKAHMMYCHDKGEI